MTWSVYVKTEVLRASKHGYSAWASEPVRQVRRPPVFQKKKIITIISFASGMGTGDDSPFRIIIPVTSAALC